MATALKRIAFVSDSTGQSGSNTPKTAAAVNAAFGRFGPGVANTFLIFGGDTYDPYATAAVMPNYDQYYNLANIVEARSCMTPGNHDNGPGGASTPSATAWLSYNSSKGTLTKTNGGWIDQPGGIPNTDQFIDMGGFRWFFINSGAVLGANATPGWPVPHSGGSVAGNARVTFLRNNWLPNLKNIVVTHHPRYSYYGNHNDNPNMQNLVDEIMGRNDGTGPHAALMLCGHDHNMQLFQPQFGTSQFPGLTEAVIGLGATGPYTAAGPATQTSKKTWLQFANITAGACGFLQIDVMDDGSLQLSIIDAANTTGNLMVNTASTGLAGAATATIQTTTGVTPTITYQHRVDGGSWINDATALSAHLATLSPGIHIMEIKRLSGTDESGISSYAWEVPSAAPTTPLITEVLDEHGVAIPNGGTTTSQEVNFIFSPASDIPAGVPPTAYWLYRPKFTGCIFGVGPGPQHTQLGNDFVNGRRRFFLRTTGDSHSQFATDGKDEAGVQQYTKLMIDQINDEILPALDGTTLGYPCEHIITVLGQRSADLTWPGGGNNWASFNSWVYGDNSYVDRHVTNWANLIKIFPRRVIVRLWHEQGNSGAYHDDVAHNFIPNFRKVAIRWRQLGALDDGLGNGGKAVLAWNPASHLSSPGSDVSTFPGTYPTQPGGVDWIGIDAYSTAGTSYPSFSALHTWYDFWTDPANNPDDCPLVVCETGIDTTSPNRIADWIQYAGNGNNGGLLESDFPKIKAVMYWDGGGKELLDTPTGYQAAFADSVTASYFIPSNIVPSGPVVNAKLDNVNIGSIGSPYSPTVAVGTHTLEVWTVENGIKGPSEFFTWTVRSSTAGDGSGTYLKNIAVSSHVSPGEIWVRAVGEDGVATVARTTYNLALRTPKDVTFTQCGSNAVAGTGTTIAFTLTRAIAPGNSLLVGVLCNNSDNLEVVTGVTVGATALTQDKQDQNGIFQLALFRVNLPGGAALGTTVTATFQSTATRRIIAGWEVAGMLAASPKDKEQKNTNTGVDFDSGVTADTIQENEIIFNIVAYSQTLAANTDWDGDVGYTQDGTFTIGATSIKTLIAQHRVVDTIGPQRALVHSHAASGNWLDFIVTYKQDVTVGAFPPSGGFNFPQDGAKLTSPIVPIAMETDDSVTSVNVYLQGGTPIALSGSSPVDGIITWTGQITIPADGSPQTIFADITSP